MSRPILVSRTEKFAADHFLHVQIEYVSYDDMAIAEKVLCPSLTAFTIATLSAHVLMG